MLGREVAGETVLMSVSLPQDRLSKYSRFIAREAPNGEAPGSPET